MCCSDLNTRTRNLTAIITFNSNLADAGKENEATPKGNVGKMSPRYLTIRELLQTEKNYVAILQTVLKVSVICYRNQTYNVVSLRWGKKRKKT